MTNETLIAPAENKKSANHMPYLLTVNEDGVFYTDDNDNRWICSKLEIKALVRDRASENWGRLLEFMDADGNLHTWAMPMEMLKGGGEELRGELLRLGLEIAPGIKPRNLLIEYITTAKPEARARCVTRTGWYDPVFVLPDRTIGDMGELIIYQSENQTRSYCHAGTLDEWRQQVGKLCAGNSRLILAVSCAFAAMLLHHAGMESGGIHLVGASSGGKTTALRVAASVFGLPQYVNRWRATTNGLEALAALHSDTLLVLDELAQVDPRETGEIAYMLANGSGKARANRTGAAKTRYEWRMLFLSAGEVSLSQHMLEVGKKARAGQEVRLVDVPADAGAGFGIFETLHQANTGAEFSQALLKATSQYYGTPAIVFLESITKSDNFLKLSQQIKQLRDEFLAENLPTNACGQVHRVCERFALIATAGELATSYGVPGWQPQEAKNAIVTCFQAWLEQRGGTGDQERINILSQVRSFLEAHGESRFTEWDSEESRTINRTGFKKTTVEGTQFYVLAEAFSKEICAGLDSRAAARILLAEGWLIAGEDGKTYRREYLPRIGRSRCYVLTEKVWEG